MNLNTAIDIDFKGFFSWWGAELAFLLPKNLRQLLRERHGQAIFEPNAQGFELSFHDDDTLLVRQQLDDGEVESWQQMQQQFHAIAKAEFILRLPASAGLQKVIYLPTAAQENLQQVVGFELDRYTPFTADQVYFALVPLGATEYLQLKVLLIVVPKSSLDAQLQAMTALGVQLHRVDYAPAVAEFPQIGDRYNLLPEQFRPRQSRLKQALQWLLGTSILSLLLAMLVLPVWMEGQEVDSLKSRIKQLEKQNQVVDAQQSEIDAVRAETQKLIDYKQQAPVLLAVLSELSRLLNDNTWLTHFHFSEDQLQIQGQSPAASALISTLEESEFFSDVSFVSPLTQDKTTGRERFQIRMTVVMPADWGRKAPGATITDPASDVGPDAGATDQSGSPAAGEQAAVPVASPPAAPPAVAADQEPASEDADTVDVDTGEEVDSE